MAGVDHRPRPVELLRSPQLLQQDDVKAVPHAGLVPSGQPPPARHARAEAELLGQVLPLDAGVQDEQDPAQSLPVRNPRPPGDQLRTRLRQQRLDQRPQFVRHDPRTRVPLPHEQSNEHLSRQSHHQRLLLGPLNRPDCGVRENSQGWAQCREAADAAGSPGRRARTLSMREALTTLTLRGSAL